MTHGLGKHSDLLGCVCKNNLKGSVITFVITHKTPQLTGEERKGKREKVSCSNCARGVWRAVMRSSSLKKGQFCLYLLTVMLFQNHMTYFILWNITGEILKNVLLTHFYTVTIKGNWSFQALKKGSKIVSTYHKHLIQHTFCIARLLKPYSGIVW